MRFIFTAVVVFLMVDQLAAQKNNWRSDEVRISPLVEGTLLIPKGKESSPLVILVQGSGPVDRNGNQPMMSNNSLKMLAEGLAERGMATFRYDKRLIRLMQNRHFEEEKVSFDDFVADLKAVVHRFASDPRFDKIVLVGHSQGSLVALLAAQEGSVSALVSIAGAGQEIDDVIVDQLGREAPMYKENARSSFDDLRERGYAKDYMEEIATIFRPSIQPFLLTWMQYDPRIEIAKLSIPVLILNGDADLQVDVQEAHYLAAAASQAQLHIIENMNHVLKTIDKQDYLDNGKSYNEPKRPLSPELLQRIKEFVEGLR